MRKLVFVALVAFLANLCTACGGGGLQSPTSPTNSTPTVSQPVTISINNFTLNPFVPNTPFGGVNKTVPMDVRQGTVLDVQVNLTDSEERRIYIGLFTQTQSGGEMSLTSVEPTIISLTKTGGTKIVFPERVPGLIYNVLVSNRSPVLVSGNGSISYVPLP